MTTYNITDADARYTYINGPLAESWLSLNSKTDICRSGAFRYDGIACTPEWEGQTDTVALQDQDSTIFDLVPFVLSGDTAKDCAALLAEAEEFFAFLQHDDDARSNGHP